MTYEQILSDIRKKIYYPIYVLMGEEPYFIDMISDTLEDEVLDEADKAFNQVIMYGRDVDLRTIVNQARNFPMMGNYLMVIVKEAQDVKDIDELEKYLDSIPKTTILVIDYKYKKLDKRKSLAKKVDKIGVLFESKKLYDSNIPSWIKDYIGDKGYTIMPKATQMLADYLGNDLHKIRNELDKLLIAVAKSSIITDLDVERNIGISKDFNVFELQNAIGRKDIFKANQIISYFGDNSKENPIIATVIILYGYFTKILKVHYASDKSQNALASVLMVHPFFVKDYLEAAKNYSIAECVRCVAVLREFDMKSKGYNSAAATDKDLYREMLFKLLHAC
jgi:DNA polymerase III, delta subunit